MKAGLISLMGAVCLASMLFVSITVCIPDSLSGFYMVPLHPHPPFHPPPSSAPFVLSNPLPVLPFSPSLLFSTPGSEKEMLEKEFKRVGSLSRLFLTVFINTVLIGGRDTDFLQADTVVSISRIFCTLTCAKE
jgi:hypothetical protein